jgi:tryptophan synthase alpha chain
MATIFFLSPTTTNKRRKEILRKSTGFVYYVSLTGVTGARKTLPSNIMQNVKAAQRKTQKPICVGFGISSARQVRSIAKVADGIIVGSAIIREIRKNKGKKNIVNKTAQFVQGLTAGLRGV